jgi:restriction endonuclease S subunit
MVNGWTEKYLGDLFDFSGGLSASRADLSTKGYPYLHYGDIHGSTRTFVDVCADGSIPRLDVDLNKVSNASLLNDGDVVFVDASEDDEGASRHIVVRNADDLPFISGLHTIVAKAKTDELDNNFREYCFQSALIKSQFKFYAVGTKVTGVSKTTIGKIVLSYPKDKHEQHRIAEALSDTDALISALEKLIAKKRAIKRGVMQELLTGKRRLPGFSGEWVEKKLGEIGVITGSGVDKKINANEIPVTLLNYLDVYRYTYICRDMLNHMVTAKREKLLQCNVQKGDVFFTPTSETADDIAKTAVAIEDMNDVVYSYHVVRLRPFEDNDGIFVKYACDTTVFIEQTTRLADGSGTRYIISLPKFREKLIILVPPTIAQILSDIDAEIDALTTNLNKLRNIKQGMMNELLTGRIRLLERIE